MTSQSTTPPETLIDLKGVTKVYGTGEARVDALRGIDMEIKRGEFVAIMGHSGSGKSTAMNIIGCLDKPTEGTYHFGGVSVGDANRHQRALLRRNFLGFVFQGYNLIARTSALDNVELPLIYQGISSAERHKMALEALARVGLQGREDHQPSQLSGGQQQRVAIARAIATNPQVVLADEPTGNLDTEKSEDIMHLLKTLNRDEGITIVMVTHEHDMAAFADRLIVFRDGSIEADGNTSRAA